MTQAAIREYGVVSRTVMGVIQMKKGVAFLGVLSLLLSSGAAHASVVMTVPVEDAVVSSPVRVVCTDAKAGVVYSFYLDDVFVANSTTGSWTQTMSSGFHYLVCNAYIKGVADGSATADVTVASAATPTPVISTPVATPTPQTSPSPVATPTPQTSPSPVATPTPVRTPTPTVTGDVDCTGAHDSAALNAAFISGAQLVRSFGPCGIDTPLTIAADKVGYQGDGSPWTASGNGVIFTTGPNSYNTPAWSTLVLRGPGTGTATVGLQVNGNFGNFTNLDSQGFGTELAIGPNGYLATFVNPRLAGDGNGTGIACPTSPNAGEGITFLGGVVFNLAIGSSNQGCGMTFVGTHTDTISASPAIVNEGSNGASTDFVNAYFEETGSVFPSSGAIFTVTGYNGYGSLTFVNGQIQEDDFNTPPNLINLTNNAGSGSQSAPFATFDSVRMSSLKTASLPANVAICGSTSLNGGGMLGNVPNVGVCP